jgi:siderophore synthetase component
MTAPTAEALEQRARADAVTQADRDRAADYISAHWYEEQAFAQTVREGRADTAALVVQFAKHRAAGVAAERERAAGFIADEAAAYRHAQANATTDTDKLYRMGQKDACLLLVDAIRQEPKP